MAMIKGIDVIMYEKVKIGVDEFHQDVFEETPIIIENVLVTPSSSTDIINDIQLHGKKSVYQLAIPKADEHIWEDRKVEFFDQTFHTLGFLTKGIDENIPLDWNGKISVERYG
ncbi:MAG: hypothetical protein PHT76_11515 [Anaerostipes sp.]|nr:hypothetical protein [Anaerostipes sp.]